MTLTTSGSRSTVVRPRTRPAITSRPARAAGNQQVASGDAAPRRSGSSPARRLGTALHAILIWSQLHGIVSLEIAGNFASMSIDADQLFEIQLAAITATLR